MRRSGRETDASAVVAAAIMPDRPAFDCNEPHGLAARLGDHLGSFGKPLIVGGDSKSLAAPRS